MWTSQYDIIVETLTGSEFEVTVTDKDTIGYIKSRIQKYEGIPISQQHLLYSQKELSDKTEVKDVPLHKGSRLKLVVGLKGGPVSARRVVALPEFDTTWFDLNDVLNISRYDPLTVSSPAVKLLVYKDCKDNIHRVMKFRADRRNHSDMNTESAPDLSIDEDGQFLRDNLNTMEKMHQLRTQLESKKKAKSPNQNNNESKNLSELRLKNLLVSKSEALVNNRDSDRMFTKIGFEPAETKSKNMGKLIRRINFPPIRSTIDNFTKKSNRTELNNSAYAHTYFGNNLLNKHGIAKTCLRTSVLNTAAKQRSTNNEGNNGQLMRSMSFNVPGTESSFAKHERNRITDTNSASSNNSNFSEMNFDAYRSKIRDNIRRNRSFKLFNSNELLLEENKITPLPPAVKTNRHIASTVKSTASDGLIKNSSNNNLDIPVHDLLDKMSLSTTMKNNGFCNKKASSQSLTEFPSVSPVPSIRSRNEKASSLFIDLPQYDNEFRFNRKMSASEFPRSGLEQNFLLERQYSYPHTNREEEAFLNGLEHRVGLGDIKKSLATSIADNSSLRVYKMATEAKNYEFPRLLIRETSPIESSNQLVDVAPIQCNSSNNEPNAMTRLDESPLQATTSASASNETDSKSSLFTSSHKLYHHFHDYDQVHNQNQNYDNSNLDFNDLELNLFNDHLTNIKEFDYFKKSASVLKIASDADTNAWENCGAVFKNNTFPSELDSNDLPLINDTENKYKNEPNNTTTDSVEMNDLPVMFGSSPTLNRTLKPSRLDAVPIQYRRGYSNLSEACMSSSMSSLKISDRNKVNVKHGTLGKITKSCTNDNINSITQSNHSLERHRSDSPLNHVRSYERLDRTNMMRMKNNKGNTLDFNQDSDLPELEYVPTNIHNWRYDDCLSHLNKNVIAEDSSSSNYSFSKLRYGNTCSAMGLPVNNYQSNDSLFNINFEAFDDDVFELDGMNLFDNDILGKSTSLFFDRKLDETGGNSNANLVRKQSENNLESSTTTKISNQKIEIKQFNNIQSISNDIRRNKSKKVEKNKVVFGLRDSMSQVIETAENKLEENVSGSVNGSKKTQKPRCAQCNKKLGLVMIMKCHCEKLFCAQHRYAEAHQCSYDFKTEGKKTIARDNPLVVASKLSKI